MNTQHPSSNSCRKGRRAPWGLEGASCFHLPQLLIHSKHHPPCPYQTEVGQRSWNTRAAETTRAFSLRMRAGPKSTGEKNTTLRPDWLAPRESQPIGAVCNAGVGSVEAPPLGSCRQSPWETRTQERIHLPAQRQGFGSQTRTFNTYKVELLPLPHPILTNNINLYLALVSMGEGGSHPPPSSATTLGVLSTLRLTVGVHSTLLACEGRRKRDMFPGP